MAGKWAMAGVDVWLKQPVTIIVYGLLMSKGLVD